MFNAIKQSAQKSVMTVTSWYRVPAKGMDRFELLAMSSCVPFKASKQYDYKYHFVCPFHVVAPYLFKSYFPDSSYPWLQYVTEDNVILTAEFRDMNGNITNRVGVNNKVIAHNYRDLCCFHLHKEEEALETLKMYGMDPSPSKPPQSQPRPNSLEEVDALLSQATSRVELHSSSIRRLREENEPYNAVHGLQLSETSPKKGEPILLAGHRREAREDAEGRDVSILIPFVVFVCVDDEQTSEGRALHIQDGRSMVTSSVVLPGGMVGGGAFDVEGNCKGMIEGIVHSPGMNINGHVVPNTHAQNVYENCAAIINADVLSDFVVDVELGLLDDMQEEVRKMRKQMGEEQIKEEKQKIMKPMMEAIQKSQ
ncbi:uncharacterized protein [Blastocystis hominis]|uniref:Uncharacterized protein n=1 Tax=Blastocystis hominis TaxID=12968 RepID=D8M1L7_BLAHO|nr:uncharacterized protein [Blastocystis hominis]CBK21956.2 unnamed protein product [Blastocystis hominis]|eukprot:XP_012896004.1 uncharacterized protein [Blastocystis hominis]